MAHTRRAFQVQILTPSETVGQMEAHSARLPGSDGMVGLLGSRAPLTVTLRSGPMRIEDTDGNCHEFFVDRGFAQMHELALTVLAEECLPIAKIDAEEAWEQIRRARQMPARTDVELAQRDEALAAAQRKFAMAQRHRHSRGLIQEGGMDRE